MCSFILQADIVESQEQLCLLGVCSRKYLPLSASRFPEAQYPVGPSYVDAKYYLWILLYRFILFSSCSPRWRGCFCSLQGGWDLQRCLPPKLFYDSIIPPSFQFPLIFPNLVSCLPSTVSAIFFLFCLQAVFSGLVLASLLWENWPRSVGKLLPRIQDPEILNPTRCISDYRWDAEQTVSTTSRCV